jgi:hypothetical protein
MAQSVLQATAHRMTDQRQIRAPMPLSKTANRGACSSAGQVLSGTSVRSAGAVAPTSFDLNVFAHRQGVGAVLLSGVLVDRLWQGVEEGPG